MSDNYFIERFREWASEWADDDSKNHYSDNPYEALMEELSWGDAARNGLFADGLGVVMLAANYGGEGQGDEYWAVFSVTNGESERFVRVDGWYASYEGGYLDGDPYEVVPKEKVITVYVAGSAAA